MFNEKFFKSNIEKRLLICFPCKQSFNNNFSSLIEATKLLLSRLLGEKKHVLFAFEEAIGFMCGSAVLDKDGVSAVARDTK